MSEKTTIANVQAAIFAVDPSESYCLITDESSSASTLGVWQRVVSCGPDYTMIMMQSYVSNKHANNEIFNPDATFFLVEMMG